MSDDALLTTYVDPEQVKEDLHFDLTDLDGAMQKHASMFIHYAQIAVRARSQYDRWKSALEVLESQLDNHYRTTLKEENPKTTEPQIRSAVVNDPRWKVASARVIEAKTQHNLAESVERAFEHRKDMLLQIARNVAKENEGRLRVAHNAAAASGRERFLAAAAST